MQQGNLIPYMKKLIVLAYLLTSFSFADALSSSTITLIDSEYNNTSWGAANLLDNNSATRWLSLKQTNDLNFQLTNNGEAMCLAGFDLTNYVSGGRGVKQFVLLTTQNDSLSTDAGTIGWQPLVADENPVGYIDYLSWAQGARLVAVDSEYNSTTLVAKHINDGSPTSRWLSRKSNNVIEYNFDTDWNGATGDGITINALEVSNYGNTRSVKEFQVEITSDGTTWRKLQVPGTGPGDLEYIYTRYQDGGILGAVDSQYNATTYGADNMQDGDQNTRWLSGWGNNTIEFTFDPNNNGISGADGDTADVFSIDKISIENYGNDDRSLYQFQLAVKTLANPDWHKITAPSAIIGEVDYNFAMSHHGGALVSIDSEYNSTTSGAKNLHDGDFNTRWLSRKGNNELAFQFDANEDGIRGAAEDLFTLNSIYLRNYSGTDDRSINEFQIAVKTSTEPNWTKINVPGAVIGQADYNFAMSQHGGRLVTIDSEYNATSWGAKNIHDGDQNTQWLSRKSNNELAFQFDADENGINGEAADLFTLNSVHLVNYGNDDRAIQQFQIAVKTSANSNWQKINVPGAAIGQADYNFALTHHGGVLSAIDSEYNATSEGAKNLHDGDLNTRWLSRKTNNTLDFQFDPNEDGVRGGSEDHFTLESFYLVNYGVDDRAIKNFQLEVKTASNASWVKIPVSGAGPSSPDYNFALTAHGGSLTVIDSEYNATSWGAKNIHDGDLNTRWLSSKPNNTLAFRFDSNFDGISGDAINLDTIKLINYGNDDRSIQTFEVDVQISGGAWQTLNAPGGGTIFTATMDGNLQSWAITPQTNVTAVQLRTLSNYGDASYTGATDFIVSGTLNGPLYTFTAAMHGNGETFSIAADVQPKEVTDVRLRTINNHGDPSYIGARELKLLGKSLTESKTFIAAMHGNGETFSFDAEDVPVKVTDVKLITVSNYGDPSYIGARELKLQGPSVTETKTFTAAMHGNGETFTFDSEDVPVKVTDVKFITINNHGDPSYLGAQELKLQGPSVTETKTFTAAMQSEPESIPLDSNDIPVDVTHAKLITINNHGDPSYVGLREFELIGQSVTAASTFTLPMESAPYTIDLDNEDTVSGIVGARIVTIKNYGHSNTGLADFKLLGTAITPSYIFSAQNTAPTQSFQFPPNRANVFRFHSLNNHGDNAYIGAADFALNTSLCANAFVHYPMDEFSWGGAAEEVLDSTGNYNAQAIAGANTDNTSPALTGNPGTCRYGAFDGADDYIELPGTFTNLQDSFTITAWINASSLDSGSRIFADDENNQQGFGLSLSELGNGELRFYSRGVTPVSVDTTAAISPNTWTFVSAVHNSETKTRKIYINGVAQTLTGGDTSHTYTGTWGVDTGPASIGGETVASSENASSFHFNGAIDEVQVFDGAMSSSEINQIYTQRHVCAEPPVHHYEIVHDGSGLTCAAEPITIKACTNSDCSSLSTESVSLDFNITSSTGKVVKASPTFTGSTSINFNHTTAETITLSIDGASIEASNAVKCSGAGSSCDMTFADAGFRFLYGASNSEVISHQIAGNGFDGALKLQAVRSNDGVCEGIFTGDKEVSLAQQNVTPDLAFNAGLAFKTNGINIAKYPSFTDNVSLNFGSDSTAVIPNATYLDAGQIRLHAKYSNADISIVGSSDDFWVKPHSFVITATNANGDLDGNSAASTTTHKAGENFDFSVSAQNAIGALTQNYRQSDGQLQLKVLRLAPSLASAIDGQFTYSAGTTLTTSAGFENVSLTSFTAGAEKGKSLFNGAQYDELGIINLDIQDINYGGLGNTDGLVSAADLTVGRFTPAYFKQTVQDEHKGKFDAYHSAVGACAIADWAYTGQRTSDNKGAISYSLEPKITITAYNANNNITKNYTLGESEGFMKLQASSVDIELPIHDDEQLKVGNVADDFVALNATMAAGSLATSTDDDGKVIPGQLLYTFSENDHFSYQHNDSSLLAPFAAKVPFTTRQIEDSDGVKLSTSSDATEKLLTEGVEIRFARMILENSYGSENAKLRAQLNLQVYDGTNFTIHGDESCFTAEIGDKKPGAKYSGNLSLWDYRLIDINIDAIQVGDTTPSISGTFEAGMHRRLNFSPPGKQGALEWEYEVPSWLKFKWDNLDADSDGNLYDDNPSAVLNFGIYRGNDRIISWREVSN
jgi:MSHA biogenesis protein MshQ